MLVTKNTYPNLTQRVRSKLWPFILDQGPVLYEHKELVMYGLRNKLVCLFAQASVSVQARRHSLTTKSDNLPYFTLQAQGRCRLEASTIKYYDLVIYLKLKNFIASSGLDKTY